MLVIPNPARRMAIRAPSLITRRSDSRPAWELARTLFWTLRRVRYRLGKRWSQAKRPGNPKPKRSVALLVVWICSTVLGFPVAFNSLSHIRADGGHWDAVVPLNLAQATDWADARLRTFRGGHFRVWLSTVGFDETNKGQFFTGRVDIVVRDPSGVEKFVGSVGANGVNLAKTVNSGWAQVGDLDIPAAWFRPWILRARVAAADENFNGMTAQVILRKVRPELGMGGMIFYVLVFRRSPS
jgi:hypothetical protein